MPIHPTLKGECTDRAEQDKVLVEFLRCGMLFIKSNLDEEIREIKGSTFLLIEKSNTISPEIPFRNKIPNAFKYLLR